MSFPLAPREPAQAEATEGGALAQAWERLFWSCVFQEAAQAGITTRFLSVPAAHQVVATASRRAVGHLREAALQGTIDGAITAESASIKEAALALAKSRGWSRAQLAAVLGVPA